MELFRGPGSDCGWFGSIAVIRLSRSPDCSSGSYVRRGGWRRGRGGSRGGGPPEVLGRPGGGGSGGGGEAAGRQQPGPRDGAPGGLALRVFVSAFVNSSG